MFSHHRTIFWFERRARAPGPAVFMMPFCAAPILIMIINCTIIFVSSCRTENLIRKDLRSQI